MKNLKTFSEFVNESKINEGYTVANYIKDSEGDDFSIKTAEAIIELSKSKPNDLLWITSEDDDNNWDAIAEYWDNEANSEDVSKKLTGTSEPGGRGSYWSADLKIPMFKYEEQGIEAYVIPAKIYKTL